MYDFDDWMQHKITEDFLTFAPKEDGFTIGSSSKAKDVFEEIANTWGRGPGDLRDILNFKNCWWAIQKWWRLPEKKAKRYARYILTYLENKPRHEVTLIISDKSHLTRKDARKLRDLINDYGTYHTEAKYIDTVNKLENFISSITAEVCMPNFNFDDVQKVRHTHE